MNESALNPRISAHYYGDLDSDLYQKQMTDFACFAARFMGYHYGVSILLFVLYINAKNADGGSNVPLMVKISIGMRMALPTLIVLILYSYRKSRKAIAALGYLLEVTITILLCPWFLYVISEHFSMLNSCSEINRNYYIIHMILLGESFFAFPVVGGAVGAVSAIGCFITRMEKMFRARRENSHNSVEISLQDDLSFFELEMQQEQQSETIKLLKRASILMVKQDLLQADDSGAIGFSEYLPDDLILRLPGNKKHIFHREGILKWVERKQKGPLCNTEITREIIDEALANW